ncbi:acyl-CoA N-acyltransferase [Hypomontagnella monticulosa]|nr:acyl-CoA N-acyltransferase [Hypomontagnella monticulosa]
MATIRPRTDEDIAACFQVLNAVYDLSGYPVGGPGDPAVYFTNDDVAWVAEANGTIAGHIALSVAKPNNVAVALWWQQHPEDTDIAVLGRLFVNPRSRNGGTASRLIGVAVEAAREKGQRLVMFALIKDQDAIRLYRKLGWQYFGTTVFKWGEGNEMDAECFVGPEL